METETINIKNILLLEDDSQDVELTLAALEENKVAVVKNGEKALNYLYRRGKYSPRSGGNPIVVLLTSSRHGLDLADFYQNGANAYVIKPVDFSEFTKAVKELGVFWAHVNEPPLASGSVREAFIEERQVNS